MKSLGSGLKREGGLPIIIDHRTAVDEHGSLLEGLVAAVHLFGAANGLRNRKNGAHPNWKKMLEVDMECVECTPVPHGRLVAMARRTHMYDAPEEELEY